MCVVYQISWKNNISNLPVVIIIQWDLKQKEQLCFDQLPFTALIRRMGKVMFSHVCFCSHRGGPQSQVLSYVSGPRSFAGAPQFQVLFQVSGNRSFPEGAPVLARGYPSPGKEYPTTGIPSRTGLGYP